MQYEITDTRETRLLVDNKTVIEASTARKALQKYLNNKESGHINFCNTGDNNVIWRTAPFIERDGNKYHAGRISWWGIKY